MATEDVVTPPASVESQLTAALPVLRLVSSVPSAGSPKPHRQTEDLTLIEDRIIGRAKFF